MVQSVFTKKEKCCGCSACFSACSRNAISMVSDSEGFCYPEINRNRCISCGLCVKVCPFGEVPKTEIKQSIYACKNKTLNERLNSSSGGVFSKLCKYMEKEHGVIYGAAFDDLFAVKHMRSEDAEEWRKFCVSKYVQSDMNDCFRKARSDLQAGKKILFSGAPCQIAGLLKLITDEERVNLYTCDIVCHGVPSPLMWKEYLTKTFKGEIGAISFRDKSGVGWHNSTLTILDRNGEIRIKEAQNEGLFFKLYFNHLVIRPSCHICPFSNYERVGDITLGDYWGIEKHHPDFDDDLGISLVMCNTEKGHELFSLIKDDLEFFQMNREECIQPNLREPARPSSNRDLFWRAYDRYGFRKACKIVGLIPKTTYEKIWFRIVRKMFL